MVTDRGQVPYVTIVGLGALGSHLVLFARNWKASLRIIDFDRVESKNTQSQFHTKMGLRKNKAVALGASMRGLWGSSMDTVPHKLTYQSADSQLGGSDLVIDCTDNLEARKEIQDYCVLMDIACLHGCISADGSLARIVWTEDFTPDKEDAENAATCEDGRNLAFHGMVGAMLAHVASCFLDDGAQNSWQMTPSSILRLT